MDDNIHSRQNTNLLNHRGPDGFGEWSSSSGNVFFGHTRLAILDPSEAGFQPMKDFSERFIITYNGEIYNHLALRKLLPYVQWRGNSDTETLVELIASKGIKALELLKGMFAFALFDQFDGSVLLVRDRLGIKPLWFKNSKNAYSFSSEIRTLLNAGDFNFSISALSEYIGFGRFPSNGEIADGIYSVPPGGWIKITKDKKILHEVWWPKEKVSYFSPKSKSECSRKVKELVTTAIEDHLISDVGIGAFLSGGIDSSIIAIIAGQKLGDNLQTFTVGFPQKSYDEREIARKVAIKSGADHTEIEVNPDTCLVWVKEAVFNMDLPTVDGINTYIVSKAVKEKGIKVALSGLGGDELFGGYPSFNEIPWLQILNNISPKHRQNIIKLMPNKIKNKIAGISSFNPFDLTSARRRFLSVNELHYMGMESGFPNLSPFPMNFDTMAQISWAEIQSYMIPMLLRDSDQMSMSVGLEIRVPFLDHQLVENILNLPQKFKKGSGVKPLLVKAFFNELPPEVFNRQKQGFTLPMAEWLTDPLSDFLDEGIIAASDLLNLTAPIIQLQRFKSSEVHWTRVWKWAVLGHWLAKQTISNTTLHYSS